MSEPGDGNGANLGEIPHEALIDELVLRYDRADGTLKISGHVVNEEVALEICYRAARTYEAILRLRAAEMMQQNRVDGALVAAILNSTRKLGG